MNRASRNLMTVAGVLLLTFGCAPQPETLSLVVSRDRGGEIVVGALVSLTGPEALSGRSARSGMLLALDEINAAGGVDGREIRLVTEDAGSDARDAGAAARRLVEGKHVIAVLGAVGAEMGHAAGLICESERAPLILSSPGPVVPPAGYVFRLPLDPASAPVLVSEANEGSRLPAGDSAREFSLRYREVHGEAPDLAAAAGYDAARLLVAALSRAKVIDGRALRDAIAGTTGFAGVTGVVTFEPAAPLTARALTGALPARELRVE